MNFIKRFLLIYVLLVGFCLMFSTCDKHQINVVPPASGSDPKRAKPIAASNKPAEPVIIDFFYGWKKKLVYN